MGVATDNDDSNNVKDVFLARSSEGRICWDCPVRELGGKTGEMAIAKGIVLVGCGLAAMELELGRVPNLGEALGVKFEFRELRRIPEDCPNGYKSPERAFLR